MTLKGLNFLLSLCYFNNIYYVVFNVFFSHNWKVYLLFQSLLENLKNVFLIKTRAKKPSF